MALFGCATWTGSSRDFGRYVRDRGRALRQEQFVRHEQAVDRSERVRQALVLGSTKIERDHGGRLASECEFGVNEDGVFDAERRERMAKPWLAVVPPFTGSAGAVPTATGGHDYELLVTEFARRTLRDDPIEPRLEGAWRPEVVEGESDKNRVSGQNFVDEVCSNSDCGGLFGGAIGLRYELCEEGDIVEVRDRIGSEISVGDDSVRMIRSPTISKMRRQFSASGSLVAEGGVKM